MNPASRHVAIIGAGVAGLACGARLAGAGVRVSLFDKGRGPGGRCATRRAGPFAFDHGAQYATATDDRFRALLASGAAAGSAAVWRAAAERPRRPHPPPEDGRERWVGVPGMSALARHLGRNLEVRCGTRIITAQREDRRWRLLAEDGAAEGPFDILLVAVPSPQAGPLLAGAPALAARLGEAVLAPCWALMLGFAEPLPTNVAAASVEGEPLSWICHDGGKPGRGREGAGPPATTWVAHASPAWSREHLEDDGAAVAPVLLAAFADNLGIDVPPPVHLAAHRWRYARVERVLGEPCLYDGNLGIGACGDWCLGPRLEAAYLSGLALAERVMAG